LSHGPPSPTPQSARQPFKRRGHIVVTLLAVLVLMGVGPLVSVSWKLTAISREDLATAHQQNQLILVRGVAEQLDLQVDLLRSQLLGVAQTLGAAVGRRGSVPREEIRQALAEVIDRRVSYVRYTYFDRDEVRSVSAGDHPEYLEPLFARRLGEMAELMGEPETAERGKQAQVEGPILLRTEPPQPVLTITAPVVSGGSFRGVLTALVELQRMWQTIGLVQRNDSVLFATDAQGVVFLSSDVREVAPGREPRQTDDVRSFLGARRAYYTKPFVLERDGVAHDYIGTFARTAEGWGIFVQAPTDEIYWSVRHMERAILAWVLGMLGLAALAAVYLARTLSSPINRLAAASRALAGGDFSTRVAVRARNEIGELAHTFNTMAEEIETTVRRLDELFLDTIRALAAAIDAKDPYTRGHSGRVNRYAVVLAREMGLDEAAIREIHVASLLHDVGKIGIEDRILKKAGALTPEEYEIIKTHTVKGASIMAPIRQMRNMLPGIKHHHERCDGSGYPDGLHRDETPMMARIIAVADTFDAITTARPYQEPMSFEAALRRIEELKGAALDPDVVEAFNRACAAGRIRLEQRAAAELSAAVGH
jgi:HD-GYP domain-containing protein (c-di-GMP phosphodiesterase class II)